MKKQPIIHRQDEDLNVYKDKTVPSEKITDIENEIIKAKKYFQGNISKIEFL